MLKIGLCAQNQTAKLNNVKNVRQFLFILAWIASNSKIDLK